MIVRELYYLEDLMFRLLTRIICLMICFQLAVGCNSSQLSLTGGETFSFTGLIVKTFNNVNNLVFPSAMAEAKIGDISIYDISNLGAPILIATQAIYASSKSFNITVDRDQVKDRPIQFSYVAIGTTPDLRDLLENTNDYESTMDVTLDANSTYRASLVVAELTKLIASDASYNHPVEIGHKIDTFDESKYDVVTKLLSQLDIDFVKTFTTTEIRSEMAQLILLNEKPADLTGLEADMIVLKTDAKNAAQAYGRLGAKLVCGTSLAVIVDSAKYETAELFFDTTDETTVNILGSESLDVGKFHSALDGNKSLADYDRKLRESAEKNKVNLVDAGKFHSALDGNKSLADYDRKLRESAEKNKVNLVGSWIVVDTTNKITTKCNVQYKTKPPAASSVDFDKFDEADYAKLGEAVSTLDKMYDDTTQQLLNDFSAYIDATKCQASDSSSSAKDNTKILDATKMRRKVHTATDKLSAVYCPIYLKEIAIVERWYNDYIDTSLAYFAKK